MASASPGYAVAVPVQCPTLTGATSQLTTAVTRAGDSLTALDVVESEPRPASNFELARQVFEQVAPADDFADLLTLPAYPGGHRQALYPGTPSP